MKIYCIFLFCLKTTTTKNWRKRNTFTLTPTHSYPTNQPKKNVCYLKILNLNVNSRMKIYWIKNHVKQTIKKGYQKKSLKIAMFQLILRLNFFIPLLLLLFGLLCFVSLLAIACRLARTHAAWIRELMLSENPVVNNKLWQRHMIG